MHRLTALTQSSRLPATARESVEHKRRCPQLQSDGTVVRVPRRRRPRAPRTFQTQAEERCPNDSGNGRIPTERYVLGGSPDLFSFPADESAIDETCFRMTVSMRNGSMKRRLLISVDERSHEVIMDEISLRTCLQTSRYIQRASGERVRGRRMGQ